MAAPNQTGGARPRLSLSGQDVEQVLQQAAEFKGESLWRDAWRRLKQNRAAYWSLWFLGLVALISLFAPLLPLPAPAAKNLQLEPQPPLWPWQQLGTQAFDPATYWDLPFFDDWMVSLRQAIFGDWQTGHWLGTDAFGQDTLSRIVWGSRISIQVSIMATLCSLVIGVTWGATAGYLGGRVDNLMMRIVDVLYSIPFIFVVIFLITILYGHQELFESFGIDRMVVFYLVIGAIYWLTMARVVRGQVLSLKNAEFVEAARVLGASTPRILFVHLVPNVLSVVIVYLTLTIPAVMLFEAFLTFLGLGVEPPRVSWGGLAVAGQESLSPIVNFWWLIWFPALAMGSTLLALNVLGDGLRDALDPKLRGK